MNLQEATGQSSWVSWWRSRRPQVVVSAAAEAQDDRGLSRELLLLILQRAPSGSWMDGFHGELHLWVPEHTHHTSVHFPRFFRGTWRVLLFPYFLLSQLFFYPKHIAATFSTFVLWLMIESCSYRLQPMEILSHLLMQLNCLLDMTQSFLWYNSTDPSETRPISTGLYQCVPWPYHLQQLLSFDRLLSCQIRSDSQLKTSASCLSSFTVFTYL